MQQMNTMNNDIKFELNELKHDARNAQAYARYSNKYAKKNMSLAPIAMECKLHINFYIKRCKSIANIFVTVISKL
jgi:hypothetical protein